MKNLSEMMELAHKYYPVNTGSHGWFHIVEALCRAKYLKGDFLNLVETAAIVFHDASCATGPRETHEIDSAQIARRELFLKFDADTVELIADAIACHRASYDKPRRSALANLVAAADRDPPDARFMFRRSFQYAIEHGSDRQAAAEHAVTHIREKYGRGGYGFRNCPALYMERNAKQLELLWERLDRATADDVLKLVG